MIGQVWTLVLIQPLLNALVGLNFLFGSFGWAIVALTVLISLVSLPLMLPSLRSAEKMKELQPQLKKLQERWKDDKQKLAKAQMDFYKEKGINPASGCLPQIIRLLLLIALYNVFQRVMNAQSAGDFSSIRDLVYSFVNIPDNFALNLKFSYLDLVKPDVIRINNIPLPGVFLLLAAVTQFISGKMMLPKEPNSKHQASNNKLKQKDSKTENNKEDMMAAMQSQSLYMMPLMTVVFGYSFPSALVLYWLTMSLVMMGQQMLLKKQQNK